MNTTDQPRRTCLRLLPSGTWLHDVLVSDVPRLLREHGEGGGMGACPDHPQPDPIAARQMAKLRDYFQLSEHDLAAHLRRLAERADLLPEWERRALLVAVAERLDPATGYPDYDAAADELRDLRGGAE
jgi:hypothetical protein